MASDVWIEVEEDPRQRLDPPPQPGPSGDAGNPGGAEGSGAESGGDEDVVEIDTDEDFRSRLIPAS